MATVGAVEREESGLAPAKGVRHAVGGVTKNVSDARTRVVICHWVGNPKAGRGIRPDCCIRSAH